MHPVKDWKSYAGGVSVLMSVLALAMPALANQLADRSEPGSVIIWPKFTQGSVNVESGTPGAFVAPKTLIELGAVCPADSGGCSGDNNRRADQREASGRNARHLNDLLP